MPELGMVTIEIRKHADDFHASVRGFPGQWGCGPTTNAAIGNLVRSFPETFDIQVADLMQPPVPQPVNL